MAAPSPGPMVTPEAVPLDLDLAGVATRAIAFAIDVAILAAVALPSTLAVARSGIIPLNLWVLGFVIPGGLFVYPIAFEVLWRGRTPGKAALGLRVVTVEGSPPRLATASVRAVVGVVETWLTSGAIAMIAAVVTKRGQRLGDLAGGSLVLRNPPKGSTETLRVTMPASMAAAVLDVSAINSAQLAAIRRFLMRADGLAPEPRQRLAARLADTAAAATGTPIPAGVEAEDYLRAVAAKKAERLDR